MTERDFIKANHLLGHFCRATGHDPAGSVTDHMGELIDLLKSGSTAFQIHRMIDSYADKRKAVLTLLNDKEWTGWSDREIARQCEVSNRMVSNYREQVTVNGSQSNERKGADGRTIDTTNIGKKEKLLDSPSGFEEKEDSGALFDDFIKEFWEGRGKVPVPGIHAQTLVDFVSKQ